MRSVLPTAVPDGDRILDWTQVYQLPELPEHLVVVGSGVTGAEFASAFRALGGYNAPLLIRRLAGAFGAGHASSPIEPSSWKGRKCPR